MDACNATAATSCTDPDAGSSSDMGDGVNPVTFTGGFGLVRALGLSAPTLPSSSVASAPFVPHASVPRAPSVVSSAIPKGLTNADASDEGGVLSPADPPDGDAVSIGETFKRSRLFAISSESARLVPGEAPKARVGCTSSSEAYERGRFGTRTPPEVVVRSEPSTLRRPSRLRLGDRLVSANLYADFPRWCAVGLSPGLAPRKGGDVNVLWCS